MSQRKPLSAVIVLFALVYVAAFVVHGAIFAQSPTDSAGLTDSVGPTDPVDSAGGAAPALSSGGTVVVRFNGTRFEPASLDVPVGATIEWWNDTAASLSLEATSPAGDPFPASHTNFMAVVVGSRSAQSAETESVDVQPSAGLPAVQVFQTSVAAGGRFSYRGLTTGSLHVVPNGNTGMLGSIRFLINALLPTSTPVPQQATNTPTNTSVPQQATNTPTNTSAPTQPATHTPTQQPPPPPTVEHTATATATEVGGEPTATATQPGNLMPTPSQPNSPLPPHRTGIYGRVTSASGGAIAGAMIVFEYLSSDGSYYYFNQAIADAEGLYEILLAPSTYRIRFYDPSGANAYAYYDAEPSTPEVDPVVLTGGTWYQVSDTLEPGGMISGKVVTRNGVGIPDVYINTYTLENGAWVAARGTYSDDDGRYNTVGLPAGVYRIGFSDTLGIYPVEYYNNAATVETASDITVAVGNVVANINVELAPKAIETVTIPAGSFLMGCDPAADSRCAEREQPQHTVTLDAYSIDKNEVTNARYIECVAEGGCTPPAVTTAIAGSALRQYYGARDYMDYPMVNVTWEQANAFCFWDGKRLPTEAEWERAARGDAGAIYPWGTGTLGCDQANVGRNSSSNFCFAGGLTRVGEYATGASPFGLFDMSGNAFEWTSDWAFRAYTADPVANPVAPNAPFAPPDDFRKVLRGGSYVHDATIARSSNRHAVGPVFSFNDVGFRCAAD